MKTRGCGEKLGVPYWKPREEGQFEIYFEDIISRIRPDLQWDW